MFRLTLIVTLGWIPVSVGGLQPEPAVDVSAQDVPAAADAPAAEMVGQVGTSEPVDPERLLWHVPDPSYARMVTEQELADATRAADRQYYERVLKCIAGIERPQKLVLTLEDVLQRAMVHNLAVRVASYNPAIETTQIVEAEARFDATFFYTLSKEKQNIPVASSLIGSNTDALVMSGGVAKLLATGMQTTASLSLQRQFTDNEYVDLNPAWSSAFSVELRQPFLRGFGIDYNRSYITLAKLDRRISEQAFRRQVITTLRDVEEAYWDLVRARREVVITGRLLARFEQLYAYLEQRREFDAYRIQIADTQARLSRSEASFIQVLANVRNAEDQLIALMNDPDVDLADEIELIPLDFPSQTPVVLDRLSEVQTALDHRPELFEAQLRVKQAKVSVGQAKNQALPQFDVTFRYTVDGLGPSAHDSFSEVSKNDFHEYYIALELQWPIGNRAGRARIQQMRLQHAQAIAALKQQIEGVIFDVNYRVRDVRASHEQIVPNFESVEAVEDQYDALVARAESKNYLQLSRELDALQSLASSRRTLLQSLVDFNMAIIELERAKGTLPEYNNIVLLPEGE